MPLKPDSTSTSVPSAAEAIEGQQASLRIAQQSPIGSAGGSTTAVRQGPAWIRVFSEPITPVRNSEVRSSERGAHPALIGLSFAVKDNIDVAGFPTTAACPEFDHFASEHAFVVQRLLESGAQLIGKTNLDQFACGLNGTRSPFGVVPNSLDSDYVCGGSSSGSAFAVASGQVDFALGTDTAGSGRVPAGLNNIVGLKPSRGLISTRGVLPAAQSIDCVSIFARTVGLAVRVLEIALAFDGEDPYSQHRPMRDSPYGGSFRFGVPDALEFQGDDLARLAFLEATERLTALGGVAVTIDFSPFREAGNLLYESALVAERYCAIRSFFDSDPTKVMEPVRTIIEQGRQYSAADLYDAQHRLQECAQRARRLWQAMDVLIVPTAPTHYRIDAMLADPIALNRNLGSYTNFVNLLDYAAISIPSSMRSDGLPFGITFIGPAGSDWALADLGQRYHHSCSLKQGATNLDLPDPITIPGLTR